MGRTVVNSSSSSVIMCPLGKYLSGVFNYFLVTTFILVIMSYSAAGENPTVEGELVQKMSHGNSEDIEPRLVHFGVRGRKEVIKCNATSVKSIQWLKGDSNLGKETVMRCSDKRKKPNAGESEEDFLRELDAPCTEEVEVEEDSDGGVRTRNSVLKLVFVYMRDEDYGPYTCITKPLESPSDVSPFGTTIFVQQTLVRLKRSGDSHNITDAEEKPPTFQVKRLNPDGRPFEKGHRSITVITGNILSIYCNVTGVNATSVTMQFYKDGVEISAEELRNSGEKIRKWTGFPGNAIGFDFLEAEAKHRGMYKCVAHYDGKVSEYEYLVRTKDKMQPLWPFLGICGEVAFLCIIIVVYEKKRNKQELEESDTDGSPDQ